MIVATSNKWGEARAYVIGESGTIEAFAAPMKDGVPMFYNGEPIPMDGEVVPLTGWSDDHAVIVNERLMIGVEIR